MKRDRLKPTSVASGLAVLSAGIGLANGLWNLRPGPGGISVTPVTPHPAGNTVSNASENIPKTIPALLKELANDPYGKGEQYRGTRIRALTEVCGGLETRGPCIAVYLHARDPALRASAAQVLGLASEFVMEADGHFEARRRASFQAALPELAVLLNDPIPEVRDAATNALNGLSYNAWDAPWQTTFDALRTAARSSEAGQRRAAAGVLAMMPAHLEPLLPEIRALLLDADVQTQDDALRALTHLEWIHPGVSQKAMLRDLYGATTNKRRAAVRQIKATVEILWNYGVLYQTTSMQPVQDDLENWCAFAPGISLSEDDAETIAHRLCLVAALETAARSRDRGTAMPAAQGLDRIGVYLLNRFRWGSGSYPKLQKVVGRALVGTASAIRGKDAALSAELTATAKALQHPGAWASPD